MNFERARSLQAGRASLDLDELQHRQDQHDAAYHRDVLALPIQDRLKHFVLHFAKYAGHFAGLEREPDIQARQRRLLTDAFIICLATANCLTLRLATRVSGGRPIERLTDNAVIAKSLAIITGRMAKACEAMDHVERFDIRGELEKNVVEMANTVMSAAQDLSLKLDAEVVERWRGIAKRADS